MRETHVCDLPGFTPLHPASVFLGQRSSVGLVLRECDLRWGGYISVREIDVIACSSGKVSNKRLFEFHKLHRLGFEQMLDGDVLEDPLVELVGLVVLDVHER